MVKLQPQSSALVNYTWSDVAAGTGYVTYYLIESEDSTGTDYHLTTQIDYSSSTFVSTAATLDIDYDLSAFTIPQTINGTALFSIPCADVTGAPTATFTVELYNWDGSAETKIGSTVTSAAINLTTTPQILYLQMPVTNAEFAVGDSLRLRIAVTSASGTTAYGIDPAARADAALTLTTQSKIQIPYKLDL